MLNLVKTLRLFAFPIFIKANSSGGPSSACETMMPGHGVSAQTSALAESYSITLSKTDITVGETIDISIVGQHKGVLLQVRPMDGSFSLTGEFSDPADNYRVVLKKCTKKAEIG